MSILRITGLKSIDIDSERSAEIYFELEHNGKTYQWTDYAPIGPLDLGQYLESKFDSYASDINTKEAEFASGPMKDIYSVDGIITQVPKSYEEVVHPIIEYAL